MPSSVSTTTNRRFRSPPHTGYVSIPVISTRTSRARCPTMVHDGSASGSRLQGHSVTLDEHLRRHANYIANLSGWELRTRREIDTVADLHKVGSVVPAEVRGAVLGTNWLNFLRSTFPQTS